MKRFRFLPLLISVFIIMTVVPGLASAQGGGHGPSDGASGDASGTASGDKSEPAGSGSGEKAGSPGSAGSAAGKASPGGAGSATSPQVQLQKIQSWLETSKEGKSLSGVRESLMLMSARAIEAGVPYEAFVARIREAVAKGANPDIIVTALEADASRWIWVASIVEGSSWPPQAVAPEFYVAAAAALRNGVDEASTRTLVEWSRDSRVSAEKAGAALTTAAAVSAALRFMGTGAGSGNPGAAALILIRSRLRVKQYSEVADLAGRAHASGMGAELFMAALEATIGKGGSLSDLEKTLFK